MTGIKVPPVTLLLCWKQIYLSFLTMVVFLTLLALLLVSTDAHRIPKPEDSKESHFAKDNRHFQTLEEHNAEYDHKAFLGSDANTFDELSPEESKRRLGAIVDKIDKDKDGFVTREELKDWIQYTQRRYISDDVDRQWKTHNPEGKEKLSWAEYKKIMYSFLNDVNENELEKDSEGFSYQNLVRRDRRRWGVADKEGDDALTKEEFAAFLHPEETAHMRDLVVLETMEDIDKDGDGNISIDEYIGDMYRGEPNDIEPDWVKSERDQFKTFRDKDGNGIMDLAEVKDWIIPPDFDHADAEAHHLIHDSDTDIDGKLTKEEVLGNYDIFVGSQATDFGEALTRHDEF